MTSEIQVLHLEDNLRDAELILAKLTAEGLACVVAEVRDRAGFAAALAGRSFDVILCDYNLPDYDGLSALKLAREMQPATPVILISGSLGEEEAVKSLQMGATDYLLKQHLERVAPAVRRALDEASKLRRHHAAVESLRESEMRFRQLAESVDDIFWMRAKDAGGFLYVSPAYETIWGRPLDALYASPLQWGQGIHPEDRERISQAVLARQSDSGYEEEYRVVRPDGKIRWVHDRAFPVRDDAGVVYRLAGITKDISERKQAEKTLQEQAEMLQRMQRLESLGMLAAGIAHDFNNILAPMVMAGPLLETHVQEESGRRILDIVAKSAKRGAALVGQLLSFARGASGEAQVLQLRHVLKDVADLAETTFPKSIRVQTRLARDLWPISGNATQLHQVVLNLCVNARDAMPEGGELRIVAGNRAIAAAAASAIPGGKSGSFVVVEVSDTGTGIPPDVLSRIWEPFFTTKGPGKGTGLGLATVRGILQGHGGFITVQTQPGRGTTFTLYLPTVATKFDGPESSATEREQFRGNGEVVLVVDDEDAVRELASSILTRHGYKVLAARDGAEAISVFTAHANEVKLLLTDLQMPLLSGSALITAILRLQSGLRVIAMSGVNSCPPELIEKLAQPIILKPFDLTALLMAVHTALHDAPSG